MKQHKKTKTMVPEDSIIELLHKELDKVPLSHRAQAKLAFGLNTDSLDKNLESVYHTAISRLTHIDYYFQWSHSLHENSNTRPPKADFLDVDGLLHQFNDLDCLKEQEVRLLNHSFAKWVSNLLLRELDEFLQYYLLATYEKCLMVNFVNKEITPEDVVNARGYYKKFEESSLKDRLKTLRKDFNIDITHKSELYSLHKLRHIFAHFDGVVQKKNCNKSGKLEVSWPVNRVYVKNRETGKLVPIEQAARPLNKKYGQIQITWLSKPERFTYSPNEKIEISHEKLNQIAFFFLYIFNELHDGLVTHARSKGFSIRPFQAYSLTPELCLIGE